MKGVIAGASGLACAGENVVQKMRKITISLYNCKFSLLEQVYTKFMAILVLAECVSNDGATVFIAKFKFCGVK